MAAAAFAGAGCATGSGTATTAAPASAPQPAISAPPSAAPTTGPSRPLGVAVIGHSAGTGADSDPERQGQPAPANSWATGTNPAVQSIYLRLLAQDPSIEGHALNLAIGGSDVDSLIAQATQAVTRDPQPQLVIIETIDNDVRCDGTDDANFDLYRTKLTHALDVLTTGMPEASLFVVSQWGTVKEYDRVMFGKDPAHLKGDGPCDVVNASTGKLDPAREAYLQGLVDAYWKIVTDECARYPACRTDGGAAKAMSLDAADISGDGNHLSIVGLAKKAAIEWPLISAGG